MAAGDLNISGWTSQSLVPARDRMLIQQTLSNANAQDQASRTTGAVKTPAGNSLREAATQPITAADLLTTPQTLSDPSLGSRQYTNPLQGLRQTLVTGSAYAQPNLPAFLQGEIANLNSEQALRRSLQTELVNRLLGEVQGGNYLAAEALRAAAATPGAHLNFGAAVSDPNVGVGYRTAAEGAGQLQRAQAAEVGRVDQIQKQIQQLTEEKGRMRRAGPYTGSREEAIDRELFRLRDQAKSDSPTTQVSARAAGATSGVPILPNY